RVDGDTQVLLDPLLADILVEVARAQRPVKALLLLPRHRGGLRQRLRRGGKFLVALKRQLFLPVHALRLRSDSRIRSAMAVTPRRSASRTAFSASVRRYPRLTRAETASADSGVGSPGMPSCPFSTAPTFSRNSTTRRSAVFLPTPGTATNRVTSLPRSAPSS